MSGVVCIKYADAVIAFEKSITPRHNGNCSNSNFFLPLVPRTPLRVLARSLSQHVSLLPLFASCTPTAVTSSRRHCSLVATSRVYNKLLASFTLSLSLPGERARSSVVYIIICTNALADDALSTAIEKLSRNISQKERYFY